MAKRLKSKPGDIIYKIEICSDGLDVGGQKLAAILTKYHGHLAGKISNNSTEHTITF